MSIHNDWTGKAPKPTMKHHCINYSIYFVIINDLIPTICVNQTHDEDGLDSRQIVDA